MSAKKGKKYSHLIYSIFSLGKMAGKLFLWRWVEHELKVKYLENLAFEEICCSNDVK